MKTEILIYLLSAAGLQLLFWLIYKTFLNTRTSLSFERVFLNGSLLLSLLLPLIEIPVTGGVEMPLEFSMEDIVIQAQGTDGSKLDSSLWFYTSSIYYVGVICTCMVFLWKIIQLSRTIHRLPMRRKTGSYTLHYTGGKVPTSSFMDRLLWDETQQLEEKEAQLLLAHEEYHIQSQHSLDRIWIELHQIFFWFNPVIYLIKRDLLLVHEAQADQASLKVGTRALLARLLLHQAIQPVLPLTQTFSQPPMARRVAILKRNFTSNHILMRSIFAACLMALISLMVACTQDRPQSAVVEGQQIISLEDDPVVFPGPKEMLEVDTPPEPKNMREVQRAIGYPQEARDNGIQGMVVTRILIDQSGKYVKHIFVKEVHPSLHEAIEREIASLEFEPAIKDGKGISFWVNIPFNFKLID